MTERRLLQLFVVGVTATLTACLTACSLVPKLVRPDAPIPDAFPMQAATVALSVQQPLAADLLWQDFFKDAQLKRLITLALANNRDLRVAVLNIEQMRAQYQIRSADQLPSISAVASGVRAPTTSGGITTTYSVGLAVTAYELDLFGRISSLKDVALSQYLATQEGAATVRISLIAAVANTYLSLLANEELLLLTQQTLRTRDESKKLTQLRFDNGVSSELDLRLAESLTEAARVIDAQQQRQRALDENALALLVGQSIKSELPSAATRAPLAQALLLAQVPAGLPSDMLLSRPDIRQVEQLLVASNANIGAARAAFFPRIALTMGVGTVSGQMAGLFDSGSWAWSMAPQLLLPIFDAGRNQAGLEAARAGQGIAVAQYEKVIQSAFREVADALTTRSTLVDQLTAQSAQSAAEAKRFKLAELRYQNGVSSYLDLLDAQRSLFTAQQAVVQTRLAQLQSQVTLYKALGGGWKDMPPAANAATSPN
jgi:multidrug efflux system outer membrane protein